MNDRFGPLHLLIRIIGKLHATHARHQPHDRLHGPHFFNLLHLREKIFQIKVCLAHFLGHALRFRLVNVLLGFLDERNHVAHAKNTRGQSLGVKNLEIRHFFADADKFYGHPCDRLDGEGRTAAGVAIQFS